MNKQCIKCLSLDSRMIKWFVFSFMLFRNFQISITDMLYNWNEGLQFSLNKRNEKTLTSAEHLCTGSWTRHSAIWNFNDFFVTTGKYL